MPLIISNGTEGEIPTTLLSTSFTDTFVEHFPSRHTPHSLIIVTILQMRSNEWDTLGRRRVEKGGKRDQRCGPDDSVRLAGSDRSRLVYETVQFRPLLSRVRRETKSTPCPRLV